LSDAIKFPYVLVSHQSVAFRFSAAFPSKAVHERDCSRTRRAAIHSPE
jgi:hypothetical protein